MADNRPKINIDYPPSIRDSAPSPTNSVASASSAVNPFPHDLSGLYARAFKAAEQAVLEDQHKRYEVARVLYLQINQVRAAALGWTVENNKIRQAKFDVAMEVVMAFMTRAYLCRTNSDHSDN